MCYVCMLVGLCFIVIEFPWMVYNMCCNLIWFYTYYCKNSHLRQAEDSGVYSGTRECVVVANSVCEGQW